MGNPVLYGLLREDTLERIVYGLRFDVEPYYCFYEEDTLFDFSASQTDTLELCIGFMGPITFDTVYYDNIFGYNRKQFIATWTSNYAGVRFYEGIGTINGLFEEIGIPSKDTDGSELICYTHGDISNCDILTQTNESYLPNIELYPNPLEGEYLHVSLPGGHGQNITAIVSDVYGKPMYEGILAPGTNKLNLGGLGKGIYFIKFLKDNKLLLNKKILKI